MRFGARDYDPVVGRWISKDPSLFGGQQANLYCYVHNDPVNFIDRTGRQAIPLSPWAAIIAGAEAGALVGAAFDGIGAIPGAAIGALLAAASVPGDSVCEIRGEGKQLDRISKDQGIPRDILRKALETIKKKNRLRGNENVDICLTVL